MIFASRAKDGRNFKTGSNANTIISCTGARGNRIIVRGNHYGIITGRPNPEHDIAYPRTAHRKKLICAMKIISDNRVKPKSANLSQKALSHPVVRIAVHRVGRLIAKNTLEPCKSAARIERVCLINRGRANQHGPKCKQEK